MIELNDIYELALVILAGRLSWDVYGLVKDILIDNYIRYRKDND